MGRRRVLLAAVVVLGCGFLLFLTAPGVWALYLARLVQGVGVGLLTNGAGVALADLHPRRDVRAAAVANSAAASAGIALGAVLAGGGGPRRGRGARTVRTSAGKRARRCCGRRRPSSWAGPSWVCLALGVELAAAAVGHRSPGLPSVGASLTGASFGLTFTGSTAAVSVPIVAVGAAQSWLGPRGAFTTFGVFVGLTALVAAIVTVRGPRLRP